MAAQRTHFWPRLALFLLIGIGLAIVWAGVAAFVVEGAIGQPHEGRVVESIKILSDGEPVISSSIYRPARVEQLPDQTLERRPAELGERASVSAARFNRLWLNSRRFENTDGYLVRVLEVGDSRLDAVDEWGVVRWYAVRDGSDEGRAYVVGFDVTSKLPLGYFGRRGFVNAPPGPVDQFVVGDLNRRAATFAWARSRRETTNAFAYFLDGDRLVEVNTRGRAVREVATLPGSLTMAVVSRPLLPDSSEEGQEESNETRMERAIVVWQGDRVSVVDPRSGDVESFRLPDEVRQAESFGVHFVGPGVAVFEHYPRPNDYGTVRLVWTTADGAVTREETVNLSGYRQPNERVEAVKGTAILPVPLLLGTLIALHAPESPKHQGESVDEALRDLIAAAWLPFGVLFLVSVALACWVWTAHRRDSRPYAALWSALVFLLGPAAWLAYVAERPRTPVATCPACGKRSPRNRVECAACGEDAFRPRMLGTEVFA